MRKRDDMVDRGGEGGGEMGRGYPIPDHVQLILQPNTTLNTENPTLYQPYFLELYHYKFF